MTHLENVDLDLWFDQTNSDYYIYASVWSYIEKWVWLCSVFLQVGSAFFWMEKEKINLNILSRSANDFGHVYLIPLFQAWVFYSHYTFSF